MTKCNRGPIAGTVSTNHKCHLSAATSVEASDSATLKELHPGMPRNFKHRPTSSYTTVELGNAVNTTLLIIAN